jgi:hypothetical protein
MENLYNDIYYVVMMNMDPETLYHFCHTSKKYSNICENNAFWKEYMMTQFNFYIPKDYNNAPLNPIISTYAWHDIFEEAYHLNTLLEGYDNQTVTKEKLVEYIHYLVQHNHIDILRMYLLDKETILSSIIIDAGVLYDNDIILDYLYNQRESYFLPLILMTYGTPYSYDYIISKGVSFTPMFILNVIKMNNVVLFKHLMALQPVTQKMLDTAIINGSIEITDLIRQKYPNLDPNVGANTIYNSMISKLFSVSKNRDKLINMEAYLLENRIYGNNSNAVLYAIKTGNIDMLDYFYQQGKFADFKIDRSNPLYNNPITLQWLAKHNLL